MAIGNDGNTGAERVESWRLVEEEVSANITHGSTRGFLENVPRDLADSVPLIPTPGYLTRPQPQCHASEQGKSSDVASYCF